MNGHRIEGEKTIEGVCAVLVKALISKMANPVPMAPDYSDIKEVLRPYIQSAILRARYDQMRRTDQDQRAIIADLAHLEVDKEVVEERLFGKHPRERV